MNAFLWVLQVLLALHTVMGAGWKFTNTPASTEPSIAAIPQGLWLALSALEVLCAIGLLIPVMNKRLGRLVPIAALALAAEMLLYIGIGVHSGLAVASHLTYWGVLVAIEAFIAYGRLVLRPIA